MNIECYDNDAKTRPKSRLLLKVNGAGSAKKVTKEKIKARPVPPPPSPPVTAKPRVKRKLNLTVLDVDTTEGNARGAEDDSSRPRDLVAAPRTESVAKGVFVFKGAKKGKAERRET